MTKTALHSRLEDILSNCPPARALDNSQSVATHKELIKDSMQFMSSQQNTFDSRTDTKASASIQNINSLRHKPKAKLRVGSQQNSQNHSQSRHKIVHLDKNNSRGWAETGLHNESKTKLLGDAYTVKTERPPLRSTI